MRAAADAGCLFWLISLLCDLIWTTVACMHVLLLHDLNVTSDSSRESGYLLLVMTSVCCAVQRRAASW